MSRTRTPPPMDALASPSIPGASLPAPTDVEALPVEEDGQQLLSDIEEGVMHALTVHGTRPYFEAMSKQKPELFFRYVQLIIAVKNKPTGQPSGRLFNVLSPLGASPLDSPPPDA
jgi:hypothetical protein